MAEYLLIDRDVFGYTRSRDFDTLKEAEAFAECFQTRRLIVTVELYRYDPDMGYRMIRRYKDQEWIGE